MAKDKVELGPSERPVRVTGFVLLSVAVSGLLLAWPQTRWIVLRQSRAILSSPREIQPMLSHLFRRDELAGEEQKGDVERAARRARAVASTRPGDYEIQLACALEQPNRLSALRGLLPRFGNRPGLLAHILRFATMSEIRLHRPEEYLLTGGKPETSTYHQLPANLIEFDRTAALGERADPDNAFFPFMRSVALFAAHRDAEALDAIRRAGACSRWDDYIHEEIRSHWLLWGLLLGRTSALERTAAQTGYFVPHYTLVRPVARIATYLAAEDEKSGGVNRVSDVRLSLIRFGALMRADSSTSIGCMVSRGLEPIAIIRPGGAPYAKRPQGVTVDQWAAQNLNSYLTFLRDAGRGKDAGWVQAEFSAQKKVREILSVADHRDLGPVRYEAIVRLITWWAAGFGLLTDAVWLLAVAVAAAALTRSREGGRSLRFILVAALLILFVASGGVAGWFIALARLFGNYDWGSDDSFPMSALEIRLWALAVTTALPIIVTVVSLALAARRRSSSVRTLGRGAAFSGVALMLAYAAAILWTANLERKTDQALDGMTTAEGPYYAELLGKSWPGVTPMPGIVATVDHPRRRAHKVPSGRPVIKH